MAEMGSTDFEVGDSMDKETDKPASGDTKHARRRYSSDEVADIIRLGLQEDNGSEANTIDYDELVAIGKEVGVSDEQIDRAVNLLEKEQLTKDKEQGLWLKFKAHCVIFGMVNILFLLINIFTGTASFWSGYIIFGTGLFLLGHYAGIRYAPEFVQLAMDRTKLMASGKFQEYFEDDVNVGFTVADSSGLMETEGLVFLQDDSLIIEYQSKDSVLGLLKSSVKEMKVEFDEITNAKLEQKFWSSELVIQGKSLRTFRSLPGSSAGALRLKVSRQSANAATNLIGQLNNRL
jgi:hypothetical protein